MKRWRFLYMVLGAVLTVAMALGSAGAATEQQGSKGSGAYRVQLQIGGEIVGEFKEVSGLESEVEVVVEFKDGSDPITHKRAGKAKYGNIVLRRELSSTDRVLTGWYKKVLAGQTDRKSGSVIILDREGREVARYNFFEAWPCRWKAPELNSSSDTHVMEEIEFVVERLERA